MVLLTLTNAQARRLADLTDDAEVLDVICSQLLSAQPLIDVAEEPRTVIFRDEGDGLRIAAISYVNEAAADAAWDRFMTIAQRQRTTLF